MNRVVEAVAAAVGLIIVSPIILGAVIAVRLDSPGAAILSQQRVGRDRKLFAVAKFRTMHHGASDDVHRGHVLALIESGTKAGKLAARWRCSSSMSRELSTTKSRSTFSSKRPDCASQFPKMQKIQVLLVSSESSARFSNLSARSSSYPRIIWSIIWRSSEHH